MKTLTAQSRLAIFIFGVIAASFLVQELHGSHSCRECHTLASEASSLCYGGDFCGLLGDGMHQDCASCLSYVRCTNGVRENVQCPNGHVWNQASQQCDWPWVSGLTCKLTSSDIVTVSDYLRESGDWQMGGYDGMMYMQSLSISLMSDPVATPTACPNCITGKLKAPFPTSDVIRPGEACNGRFGDFQTCESCLKVAVCYSYPLPISFPCEAGKVYDPQAPNPTGNPTSKCLEPWKTNACSLTAQDQAAICSHYQGATPGSEAAMYYSTHCY
ncbi:uncharacterized protein LOC106154186 [Lingula anatina]|uniref:Uncharacterized protein LOC106154186 n=1 Tax=Lingula anatina TaxID=7574 RepID=A0A1S3HEI2_LINAN|nr:uncharacterized protein LOC106154186 [Lingula anatina]|eukprot:XP_013383911.1 uncharacterized protein LOC106154186 [Lingula anatina]